MDIEEAIQILDPYAVFHDSHTMSLDVAAKRIAHCMRKSDGQRFTLEEAREEERRYREKANIKKQQVREAFNVLCNAARAIPS